MDYIQTKKINEAKQILNNLNEPNETCLGLSTHIPQGRGVSGKQALDLYRKLAESQAAKTGLLSELAECDLFVEGIGIDKISDITTNIIRILLIEYTQEQCELHNINLACSVASGQLWDLNQRKWFQQYTKLPIINGKKIILVPKSIVRFESCLNSQEYYNHFVLNYLQKEHLNSNSGLVTVLKNGNRKVYKKKLKKEFPFNKEWLAKFTNENPEVLENYKKFIKNNPQISAPVNQNELDETLDETLLAKIMIETLQKIPPGSDTASKYHSFIIGALEFIFWPNVTCPKKEHEIHNGRKRIDITYINAARYGLFYRIHTASNICSNIIMVECKNYNTQINNPELDQLSGRFSINRGKFGLLLYRNSENYEKLISSCKDTAADGRGFIIPLGDKELIDILVLIKNNQREQIDVYINDIFVKILS